jgi:hypothetical protein
MRFLLKSLLFIFILVIVFHCFQTENLFTNRKPTMLKSRIGLDKSHLEKLKFFREIAHIREKLKNDELMEKEKAKEELLKVNKERILPLTRGNNFMRDFYSGRY